LTGFFAKAIVIVALLLVSPPARAAAYFGAGLGQGFNIKTPDEISHGVDWNPRGDHDNYPAHIAQVEAGYEWDHWRVEGAWTHYQMAHDNSSTDESVMLFYDWRKRGRIQPYAGIGVGNIHDESHDFNACSKDRNWGGCVVPGDPASGAPKTAAASLRTNRTWQTVAFQAGARYSSDRWYADAGIRQRDSQSDFGFPVNQFMITLGVKK
jgi:opacity protein-like surface antigen